MARRAAFSLLMAGVLVCGTLAATQPAPQPGTPPAPLAQPQSIAHITLGQSSVPLYGPWKFTVGDSPIDPRTGKPLWAEPDFDDSKWETVDLTPKDGAFDPVAGLSGYVPGWTAKGHPGYFGYAWYRIRVQVITQPLTQTDQARPSAGLALAGPADVDDAYQVFDNGELAGHFGDFTSSSPVVYFLCDPGIPAAAASQPRRRDWPERAQAGSGIPAVDAAIHADQPRCVRHALGARARRGGRRWRQDYQMRRLELIRTNASNAAIALLFGLLAVVAFSLILFDRTDRVYLWMGALFLLIAVNVAFIVIGSLTELLSIPTNNLLFDGLAQPLNYAAWVMVFWVWFGLERPPWLPQLTAGLTLLLMVSTVLGEEIFFGFVSHEVALHLVTITLVLRLLFFALLLWVTVEGIRRQGTEGWLVLPVVVLRGINAFATQLSLLHIRVYWFPFGAVVTPGTFANLLVAVVIALLLLRRLLQSVKRQRLMALDVKQAQEVQQVILQERVCLALPADHRERVPAGTRGRRRLLSDHSAQDRRQPADCGRRRNRQRTAGRHAGGAAGGGDPHRREARQRPRRDAQHPESAPHGPQ